MKRDHDLDQSYRLHTTALLRRLQQAGWIKHLEEPEGDLAPQIEWNDALQPMDGKTLFHAMSCMLQDLCPERPLSDHEQALIQILRQELFE